MRRAVLEQTGASFPSERGYPSRQVRNHRIHMESPRSTSHATSVGLAMVPNVWDHGRKAETICQPLHEGEKDVRSRTIAKSRHRRQALCGVAHRTSRRATFPEPVYAALGLVRFVEVPEPSSDSKSTINATSHRAVSSKRIQRISDSQ